MVDFYNGVVVLAGKLEIWVTAGLRSVNTSPEWIGKVCEEATLVRTIALIGKLHVSERQLEVVDDEEEGDEGFY